MSLGHRRDPARGSESNILHARCPLALLEPLAVAPYCISLVWLGHRISHPQEMPPSGPGRDPSAHTPGECVCVCYGAGGDGGMLPSLQARESSGDHLGALSLPLPAGEVPSPAPLPRPPSSPWLCGGMNQLSQLVKARPLVFMPSPQETELRLFQPHSAGGQGPHFINIPKPVRQRARRWCERRPGERDRR